MTTMLLDPLASWLDPGRRAGVARGAPPVFAAPTDVLSGEDEVRVVMDLPGVRADDLEIEVADGALAIRGQRRYPYRDDPGPHALNRLERGFGTFERILRVPRDLDASSIEATMDDGVLTLAIPMPDSRKPHRVEVRAGERRETLEVGDGDGDATADPDGSSDGTGRLVEAGA
ncbi:MAG: Hsp20/alpha crystallin family protein [Actinobacteria bacterium]|nr:Hsp20/alpha crystallin family protein [Actinomycetota bacterium]